MDVLQRDDLPFPRSLPEFQQLFPDEAKCAAYMEKARWGDGFVCPHCHAAGDPFRSRHSSRCPALSQVPPDTGLTVGTVMERSHMPLSTWFSSPARRPASRRFSFSDSLACRAMRRPSASTSSGMVRPNQDRIGGKPGEHVEIDEHGLVDGLAAKAGVSTTRFSSLVPSRFVIGNREPRRTSERTTLCRSCQARRSTRSERRLALWVRGKRRCFRGR